MGDRFNSFYQEDQHPFVHAMMGVLDQSLARTQRLPLPSSFYSTQDKAFQVDIERCRSTARDLLAARRARPNDKKDLLNAMINAKDPKTGEKLSDDSIMDNMVTFLVAGMFFFLFIGCRNCILMGITIQAMKPPRDCSLSCSTCSSRTRKCTRSSRRKSTP
jgi:hypothetical protein